jgi:protein pelota
MQTGLCTFVLVTEPDHYQGTHRHEHSQETPREFAALQGAITRFYENVYLSVLRHIDFAKVKAVLIGSPGLVKNDFYQYMLAESVRRDDRPLLKTSQSLSCARLHRDINTR